MKWCGSFNKASLVHRKGLFWAEGVYLDRSTSSLASSFWSHPSHPWQNVWRPSSAGPFMHLSLFSLLLFILLSNHFSIIVLMILTKWTNKMRVTVHSLISPKLAHTMLKWNMIICYCKMFILDKYESDGQYFVVYLVWIKYEIHEIEQQKSI